MTDHKTINGVRSTINKIMKNNEDRVVVGWRPSAESYKEGDVWEDFDERKWTIKNGVRQNVTKLDLAKTPWFCPECDRTMSLRIDTRYWTLFGKCSDCVIVEETKLRMDGKWAEYEKRKLLANYVASLKDRIEELKYYRDTVSSPEVIHADDTNILMIEKWNIDIPTIQANLQADIDYLMEELDKTIREYKWEE